MPRPTGAAKQSSTGEDEAPRLVQTTPQMSPVHPHPAVHALQRDSPRDVSSGSSLSLPPLRQMSSTPPLYDRKPGGPLGMHSILNPQAELLEQQRSLRRSGSQLDLPSPIENPQPPNLPSISRPTSVDSTQGEMMSTRQFQQPPPPRRGHMSPTVHRTTSLTTLNPPTGTIDAHQIPFLSPSGRNTAVDSMTSQPALPTPPVVGVAPRAAYFPSAPTPPPTMVRSELRRPSMSFPQSGSASPITGFSPYSQPASVASSQFEAGSQPIHYVPTPNDVHQMPMAVETERSRIPMASTGQSSIQIMTRTSQEGVQYQIPVDVQAASKVADEKRKRNAGASARFRARRKEKEREASMSIQRLEQALREAREDSKFYESERDYFRSLVYQQSGAERQNFGRPPSPRHRRSSAAPSNAASSTCGSVGSPYSAYEEDAMESERNVRRRTSTYHPPLGQVAPPLTVTGPAVSSYPAPAFSSVNAPSIAMPAHRAQQHYVQPQAFEAREQRSYSEFKELSGPRPQLHDPFASESAHYEQRNWTTAPGQARESR